MHRTLQQQQQQWQIINLKWNGCEHFFSVYRSLRHWRNKLVISHDGLKEIVTRQFCKRKNISEMCNFKIMINRKALLPTIDTFTNTSIHCALEPFVASTAVWPTRVLACAVLTASGEEAAFVCVWKKNSLSWKLASTRDSVWPPFVCTCEDFRPNSQKLNTSLVAYFEWHFECWVTARAALKWLVWQIASTCEYTCDSVATQRK